MVFVGVGGMIGAMLRYAVMWLAGGAALWIANGAGSFALGYLNGRLQSDSKWKLLIGTGILGSFTTFSAFSEEWFQMLQQNTIHGLLYGVGMTALCFVLCWTGLKLGRLRRNPA